MSRFNYTTKTRKILADLYTPVGVYMRLRDIYPQSALMESSDYHGSENSRSFIGVHPMASIAVGHGIVTVTYPDGKVEKQELPAFGEGKGEECKLAISKAINDFVKSFHVEGEGKDFCGLYGFTTFNAVRYFENIPVKDTTMEKNDAPDIYYIMYKDIIVFDHYNNTMELIALQENSSLFTPHSSLPSGYAVIFGNEVKGVKQNIVDMSDGCLEIPQFGTKHSLNVSVTAGIVVWEFAKLLKL